MWRTPLRFLASRRVRRALTVPNVLTTIAVMVASSGTAYAAITITGNHVKDGSLTAADFRNSSLTGADIKNKSINAVSLSSSAVKKIKETGDTGPVGPQGEQGAPGRKGTTGEAGKPAPKAFTFQTAKQSTRVGGSHVNPAPTDHLPSCEDSDAVGDPMVGCVGPLGVPVRYPRWNYWCDSPKKHCKTSLISTPALTRSLQTVMVTSDNASGGLLNMPYAGTIVLNASLTFFTQRTHVNQRIECQLQIRRVENGVQGDPIDVGVPMLVSRRMTTNLNEQELLVNLPITGAVSQPAGVFETQVACRAPDDTGLQPDRIEFIEGNLSVLSTRTNGHA